MTLFSLQLPPQAVTVALQNRSLIEARMQQHTTGWLLQFHRQLKGRWFAKLFYTAAEAAAAAASKEHLHPSIDRWNFDLAAKLLMKRADMNALLAEARSTGSAIVTRMRLDAITPQYVKNLQYTLSKRADGSGDVLRWVQAMHPHRVGDDEAGGYCPDDVVVEAILSGPGLEVPMQRVSQGLEQRGLFATPSDKSTARHIAKILLQEAPLQTPAHLPDGDLLQSLLKRCQSPLPQDLVAQRLAAGLAISTITLALGQRCSTGRDPITGAANSLTGEPQHCVTISCA